MDRTELLESWFEARSYQPLAISYSQLLAISYQPLASSMRLPFFQSSQDDRPVRVPLPETLTCDYAVFFALRGRPLPEMPQVKAVLNAWLEAYAHGPIRSDIRALVARNLLTCRSGE